MKGNASTTKSITKVGVVALITIALSAMLGLCACSGESSSSISDEDRTNAKQVIMAAGDLFTMMDLSVTGEDSPITITQDDPEYAEFIDALLVYKKVADLEVEDLSITATITEEHVATAREDSQQVNYRFTITEVSMVVDGSDITYSSKDGFSTN